jgi:hypothetical protein
VARTRGTSPRPLKRAHRRVEGAKALVLSLVDPLPAGNGLDGVADTNAALDRLVDVCEDPARDAAEQCRPVRRPLFDGRALERQVEYGCDDPDPQVAPCAAARDPRGRRLDPERAEELERLAQAVGDAFETARTSAPRSWRSERPAKAARALGSECGVRSPPR